MTAARAATTGPVAPRRDDRRRGVAIVTVARAATTALRARMEAAEP